MSKNKDKEKDQQDQPKIITLVCSMTSGLFLALCMILIPENIWPAELPEVFSAKAELIALIAASMALAALLFAIEEGSKSLTVILTSIPIGFVAWLAAFSALDVKSLGVILYTISCTVPLLVAIIGILVLKMTQSNAGIYSFVWGATMIILSFVIANTDKILLMLVVFFNSIFGSPFGADIAFAIVLFMGIVGVLMVFITLFYFAVLWIGKNMR